MPTAETSKKPAERSSRSLPRLRASSPSTTPSRRRPTRASPIRSRRRWSRRRPRRTGRKSRDLLPSHAASTRSARINERCSRRSRPTSSTAPSRPRPSTTHRTGLSATATTPSPTSSGPPSRPARVRSAWCRSAAALTAR